MAGVHRVIVGASGSPGSIPALRYAANLAHRERVLLVVVHAWTPPGGDLADRRHPSPYLRQIWAQAAGRTLAEAIDGAWGGIPDDLAFHAVVVRGEPGPALVDLADSAQDLLVLGTGRRGRLARIGHGGVSRYCLAHAQCPVIAVPPADLARLAARRPRLWPKRRRGLTMDRALSELDSAKPGQSR